MTTCERGCSAYTPIKLEHIRGLIRMHIQMAYGARKKFGVLSDYRYIAKDLNGGHGEFLCNGQMLKGSPVIFLEELERFGAPYELYVFEQDDEALASLHEATCARRHRLQHGTVEIVPGDHLVTAPIIAERLASRRRGPQFGMVLADPYGKFNADAMRPLLEWGDNNRIDGVVSVATTAHKRNGDRPIDELRRVGRPHLLIRKPVAGADGGWNWTIALLTKWAGAPEYPGIGLYRIDSPEGRAIVHQLNLTKAERLDPKELSRIAHTRSTCDIPGFGLSVRMRSRALEVCVSDAAPGQLRFIT